MRSERVKRRLKRFGRIAAIVLAALLVIAGGYAAYLLLDYERIADRTDLPIENAQTAYVQADTAYDLISYNIGFAAYTPDFSFFMDGGTHSRAASKASVQDTMASIAGFLAEQDADFLMIQEVDVDATRSRHVDQLVILQDALSDYSTSFAVNYDSAYLFYPVFQPIGKSYSGMLTGSRYAMTQSLRRSLPVESSLMKFFDLDRCYVVSRVPVENGRALVLYTVHLSAYTSDGSIADAQLSMLLADMQAEYLAGNYVVCGGDFNKDLLGDSSAYFGVHAQAQTWAQPFPMQLLEQTQGLTLCAPLCADNPVPSCRNADAPYHAGQFVLTVDGFLVSENVRVQTCQVLDTGFAWSDHNPVQMTFCLMEE